MSDVYMTYEDWLRGCVHHDGRHGYVTLPCDEVLKIADFIERLRADRKTENSSEFPNNCEECEHWNDAEDGCADRHGCKTEPTISKMEQVDKDINVRSKDEPQTEPLQTCSVNGRPYSECSSCEHFKCTADEPQTERSE